MQQKPIMRSSLLWEYNLDTFSWDRSYKIVIERIIQLGNLEEWKQMVQAYSTEEIFETIERSKQLDKKDKDFALLFLKSDALYAV